MNLTRKFIATVVPCRLCFDEFKKKIHNHLRTMHLCTNFLDVCHMDIVYFNTIAANKYSV
jgi:hypothetical protein